MDFEEPAHLSNGWSITVGDLKKALAGIPDDYEVMIANADVGDIEIANVHIDSVYPPSATASPGLLILGGGQIHISLPLPCWHRESACRQCDDPEPSAFADFHRAAHALWREISARLNPLVSWLATKILNAEYDYDNRMDAHHAMGGSQYWNAVHQKWEKH